MTDPGYKVSKTTKIVAMIAGFAIFVGPQIWLCFADPPWADLFVVIACIFLFTAALAIWRGIADRRLYLANKENSNDRSGGPTSCDCDQPNR